MMKKSRNKPKLIYRIISILLSAIFIFQAPVTTYALDDIVPTVPSAVGVLAQTGGTE